MLGRMFNLFCFTSLASVLCGCASNSDSESSSKKEIAMSIIPTDVVSNNQIGDYISTYEAQGLRVAGLKLTRLSDQKTSEFLAVVRGKENYKDIKEGIQSGPVLLVVLEGDDAVNKNIEIIGSEQSNTDVATQKKAVYWSENPAVAKMDVEFFFGKEELSSRY